MLDYRKSIGDVYRSATRFALFRAVVQVFEHLSNRSTLDLFNPGGFASWSIMWNREYSFVEDTKPMTINHQY
jgi:hypothetical protein